MPDREKLIELICSTEYGNGSLIGNNFQKGFVEKIADHLIANGVTIQKHGKWEMISHSEVEPVADYACSVCSGILIDVIDDTQHELQAYCPMCGARMNGGNDNE